MADHIIGYSLALYSLALEEKKIKEYKTELLAVIEAIESNEEIIHLLNSKSIELSKKIEIVKKSFKSIRKNILNLLFILVERSKFNLTISILKHVVKYINEKLNIKEGVVYSTEKITPKQLKDIEAKVSKALNQEITLANKLDAHMISGIRVVVGDSIIEDTVISRLEQLKYQLLDRKDN